jgi:guanylate kinase
MMKLTTTNNKGVLLVISGPSGSGKGTVLKELLKISEHIIFSISATTRSPRSDELDGVNYYFKTKEQFLSLIENNEMLEFAEYCKNYYGTPKDDIEQKLNEGLNVILEIEVQGAMQIKNSGVDAVFVFLMPPSLSELERRLRKRHTENEKVIQQRLLTAINEVRQANKYDYIVVNNSYKEAAQNIKAIITVQKLKTQNQKNIFQEVLFNA